MIQVWLYLAISMVIGVGILNLIARCISYLKRNLKVVKEEDNNKVNVSRKNIDNRLDKTIISVFGIREGIKYRTEF